MTYYAIYATNTGDWEYDQVWGSCQRVYATRAEAGRAAERLREGAGDGAPESLAYVVHEVEADDEVGDETAAEHYAQYTARGREE